MCNVNVHVKYTCILHYVYMLNTHVYHIMYMLNTHVYCIMYTTPREPWGIEMGPRASSA